MLKGILLALCFSTLCLSKAKAAIIDFGNVVFIGDSITEGASYRPAGNGDRSWRYEFWINLVNNGDTFDFVGSRTSNFPTSSIYPTYQSQTFDNRHEALWGTTSFERSSTLAWHYGDLNGDGSNQAADTAFLFLGSNDASNPANTLTSIRDQFQSIVSGLQSANGSVNVHIVSVLPRFISDTNGDGFADSPFSRNSEFASLNMLLSELATSATTSTSTVGFIDVSSAMQPVYYYDGLHPNGVGENVIGDLIYQSARNSIASVPEPSTYLFMLVGMIGYIAYRQKRRWLTSPKSSYSSLCRW